MFDSPEDWTQEMKRTKANCRLVTENENFELSQRYFAAVVGCEVSDKMLLLFELQGTCLVTGCNLSSMFICATDLD